MFSTTFSVGPSTAYRVKSLHLPQEVHQIQADFEDGEHIFKSSDFELGTVYAMESRPLIGRLSLHYSYNAEERVITVCGTNFASADGMTLITTPQGTDEVCFEHAAAVGFEEDEFNHNDIWNYRSQLMPGAAQVFKDIVQDANDSLISALETATERGDLNIVKIREPLPALPLEDYNNLCVVYRNNEYYGMYDPTHTYASDVVIAGLGSVYGGRSRWYGYQHFANVIGSTDDPKVGGQSWINLWRSATGRDDDYCTSWDYNGFHCGSSLLGGHICSGKKAKEMAEGSNSVYIFPICSGHNNNNNVYMAPIKEKWSVWLKKYLRRGEHLI